MKIPGLTKKNLIISISLIVLVLLAVLLKTTSKETFYALKSAKFSYLLLALLSWISYVVFDGLRFTLASYSIGEHKMDLITAIKVITIGIFLAAVSPFQVAGLPVQIMLLNKKKIGLGRSTALLAARGFIGYSTILIAVLISLKYIWPPPSGVVRGIIVYATILVVGILLLYSVALFLPNLVKKILKSERIVKEIFSLRETTIAFVKNSNKKILFLAMLSSFATHLSICLIPFFLSYSFNSPIDFGRAFSFQSLIQGGLLWTPTPGGTGIAESVGLFIFKDYMDKEILGVFVIIWRFFTHHFAATVGAIFLLRELREI
ncbi:MAG: lysylphosphatidylglycerol synthase transmembrane domain-containing protein [bacterium]|nr:lysylphosphatidylglycerol synthase transmembrane domain-containing protein [bacterium]